MEKLVLIGVMIVLLFSCKNNEMNVKEETFSIKERTIALTNSDNKDVLSISEMQEDLDTFIYLIETSYIGYEDAIKRGFDSGKIREDIYSQFNGDNKISVDTFLDIVYRTVIPYFADCHTAIQYKNKDYRFVRSAEIYFSDIYIKEIDDVYHVIESNSENINIDDTYNDTKEYLFLYPSKGEDVYRLGCISTESLEKIQISINSLVKEIEVHKCVDKYEPFMYLVKEAEKSIYIKYNRCFYCNAQELNALNKFANSAELCRKKDFVIIDLRENIGGNNYYGLKFISELYKENSNTYDLFTYPIKEVFSPANVKSFIYAIKEREDLSNPEVKKYLKQLYSLQKRLKKKPQKIIKTKYERKEPEEDSDFKGKIIILTDKNVASSGEEIIIDGKFLFDKTNQIVQIGRNTSGCILYGNICGYYLSNSGIKVVLPLTDLSYSPINTPNFHGEGVGFYPDYWSTDEDLNETIRFITHDNEMFELLKDIL